MLLPQVQTGMDIEEAVLRMSFSRSAANERNCWEAVGRELSLFVRNSPPIAGSPEHFADRWNARFNSQSPYGLAIWGMRANASVFGEPCAVVEIGLITPGDDLLAASRFLVTGLHHAPKVELLETFPDIPMPFNLNPPVLIGNRLAIGGMGSTGAMRESPLLQLYTRVEGRWQLKQTVIREHFAGHAYWGKLRGRSDPNHFVMEVPTDSELTEGTHPASDRSIKIEHWIYQDGRYVLARSHFWDTAMHAAEQFVLALRHNHKQLSRFAQPEVVRQARQLGLAEKKWRFKMSWMSEDSVDFSRSYSQEEPPVRLVLVKMARHWRVVKIVPLCNAANTWFAWGRAYDKTKGKERAAFPDPRQRPFSANETSLPLR